MRKFNGRKYIASTNEPNQNRHPTGIGILHLIQEVMSYNNNPWNIIMQNNKREIHELIYILCHFII